MSKRDLREFILRHAAAYAVDRQGLSEGNATLYAVWYADNYPDGYESHAKIFYTWKATRRQS